MALTHETRRALAERVHRKVEGRGIPRHVVDDAVTRVSDALARQSSVPANGVDGANHLVAVFTAPSAPDLGSRVRTALQLESVSLAGMGISTSGRHTVAAVRIAADARSTIERVASRLAVAVSFLPDPTAAS
jgi:hypothetical protein